MAARKPSPLQRQVTPSSLQAPSAPSTASRASIPRSPAASANQPVAPSPNSTLSVPRKSLVKKPTSLPASAPPAPTASPKALGMGSLIASLGIGRLQDRGTAAVRKEKQSGSSRFRFGKTCELTKLPDIMEVSVKDRPALVLEKMRQCSYVFDFGDPLVDIRSKDIKRLALNDLRNYFSREQVFFEDYYPEMFKMLAANNFRVLSPPEDPNAAEYDPDEDDPVLEPAFPHMDIVYNIFYAFISSKEFHPTTARKYLNPQFFDQLCEALGSLDAREREHIKNILHRMYGHFSHMRLHIRHIFIGTLLHYTYERETFQGIAEMLEILASIINGYATPVKPENIHLLHQVLLPLFKCKTLGVFHVQLSACVIQFIDKDPEQVPHTLAALLKYWPRHSSMKEYAFLTLIDDLMPRLKDTAQFQPLYSAFFKQLARSMASQHFQVVERTLHLLANEAVAKLIGIHAARVIPMLFPVMYSRVHNQIHWSRGVVNGFIQSLQVLGDINRAVFDEATQKYKATLQKERKQSREQEERWKKIEAMARSNPLAKTVPGGLVSRLERAVVEQPSPPCVPLSFDEGALLSMISGTTVSQGVRRRSILHSSSGP